MEGRSPVSPGPSASRIVACTLVAMVLSIIGNVLNVRLITRLRRTIGRLIFAVPTTAWWTSRFGRPKIEVEDQGLRQRLAADLEEVRSLRPAATVSAVQQAILVPRIRLPSSLVLVQTTATPNTASLSSSPP